MKNNQWDRNHLCSHAVWTSHKWFLSRMRCYLWNNMMLSDPADFAGLRLLRVQFCIYRNRWDLPARQTAWAPRDCDFSNMDVLLKNSTDIETEEKN